jgi:8-oxo-dGTP pyrophosphatase MutT (NUDIX family)
VGAGASDNRREAGVSEIPEAGGAPLKGDSEPTATPRPASTVILLRRGGKHADRGLELLLVKRNPEARFMPGVWVFPGGAVDAADGEGDAGFRAAAARELEEEAGVTVDPAELVPYSRWITPRIVPIRFDTYFYLALAPAHSPPKPDGSETVDAGWYSPKRALEMHAADEMPLVFPTIKHLESLLPYGSAEEALDAARNREVKAVEPEVVGEGKDQRIVLPEELP